MRQVHVKLLKFLINNNNTSTNKLGQYLKVTPRSVTNYINEINHIIPNTIISTKQGYKVSNNNASRLLCYYQKEVPQSASERSIYIIKYLIDNNCYNIYDLSDNLFVSYSTIKNDLAKVKKIFSDYDLKLENKNNMLSIIGNESNKRKLLCDILSKEISSNKINISKVFNSNDYEYIKQLIFNTLQNYDYLINDFALKSFTLHLLITIDRIRNGYKNEELTNSCIIESKEYKITKEIIHTIEKKFTISFTETDANETAILLVSRTSIYNPSTINENNINDIIGPKCANIAEKMIEELNTTYGLCIDEPTFYIRLAIHVKNLLLRCKTNCFQKNPLRYNIQHDCPLIYETAIKLAQIITENTNYRIPEDEIAYLSFHVGNVIESQLKIESRLKVILYCPPYYSPNKKIEKTIVEKFYDQIVIVNIINSSDYLVKKSCDFIIAVCDELTSYVDIPCVFITPFLSNKDLNKINTLITKINYEKGRKKFAFAVKKFFYTNLFDISSTSSCTKQQILHQMSNKLIDLGFAKKDFENNIQLREKMSSTSCDNFAIPHTLKLDSIKTCIYVKIIRNGINWDVNTVNIIFLLCFAKDDKEMFSQFFDSLAKILYDKENVKKLIKSTSYRTFINNLIDMYK